METMKSNTCVACFLLTAAVVGCDSHGIGIPSTPPPPLPPKACNTILQTPDRMASGDAVVIVRCRGADEYAKTAASKDWNYHWNLVTMDVLVVERGTWIDKEVNFIYPDAWPTPESGIMIDKGAFPFAKGYIFALTMKTTAQPATIVAFERRSYVSPHGPLKYIPLKPGNIEPESAYGRILKAVAEFEAAHNVPARKTVDATPEDAGDTWILHRRDGWGTDAGSRLYRIDKSTFAVQAIPQKDPG